MSHLNVVAKIAWLTLVAVALIMIGSMFYPQYRQYIKLQEQETALEMEYRLEEEKLKLLRSNRERMETDPAFVERVAREELGFAKPGETVIKYIDDQRVSQAGP